MTGRTTPQLSTARKALIDKGLIEATGQGRLRFTMPGFAAFVRDQVDVPWYGAKLQAGTLHTEQLPETPRQLPGRPIRELPPGGQGQPGTDPSPLTPLIRYTRECVEAYRERVSAGR